MALTRFLTLFTLFVTATIAAPLPNDTSVLPLVETLTIEKRGSAVPFGALIDRCVNPGQVALTFDDGPFWYTGDLLELLSSYGARSTFFLSGHGQGNIYNNAPLVQRILAEGHQLGSHAWAHLSLPSMDYPAIQSQMLLLEQAFIQIIGAFPMYMRPPYLAISAEVLTVMNDLGYHVIGASVDTKDYENDHPDLIFRSFEKFKNELNAGGTIVLSHDVHEQTVYTLARLMLDELQARGLTPVTVGECLGDPEEEWYRASR